MTKITQRTNSEKTIAIIHMIGGGFGAITILPLLGGTAIDPSAALAWFIILTQVVASIYGGWQLWRARRVGYQILYWLSWSCIPVVTFSILSYYCAIGIGAFPVVSFGLGQFGANFYFRFGYASELYFNSDMSGITIGANLVAIGFLIAISKAMKRDGIPKWPLEFKAD